MHNIVQSQNNVAQAATTASWQDALPHALYLDVETRSPLRLRDVGAVRYARHSETQILCVGYALDSDDPKIWTPADTAVPWEFNEAAQNTNWFTIAHNASFEIAVLEHILKPRFGFPEIPLARWRCTMAQALSCALPGRLDRLADALECAYQKDMSGAKLMHMMARPRRAHKDEDATQTFYFCDNDRLQRLFAYCAEDIRVTREIACRLPQLSAAEHQIWQLTHTINARGVFIDKDLAQAARSIVEVVRPELDAELRQLTNGIGANQVGKLVQWLQQYGCKLQKLDKKSIERELLNNELPAGVRRALELRLASAQSATRKIDALVVRCAGEDNRVRNSFVFHGASTGRWTSTGAQFQNLKRAKTKDLEAAITAICSGDHVQVRNIFSQPLSIVGDLSRSLIAAPSDHILVGADFSSIESRVLAWIAGETWKIGAYERYDATGEASDEPYRVTAARIFHISPDKVTKEQRNVGKVCDLAFGFQGGASAFRKFSDQFTDDEVKQFNREWRAAHPAIRKFGFDIDRAALTAVRERGRVVRCGLIALKSTGSFLLLKLPSGRKLSYPQARAVGDPERQHVVFADNAAGQFKDCRNGQGAYGGLWTENIVSGIARDLLAEAMLRIEAAGYPIVLHVHDEIVAEVPEGFGRTEEFTYLMTRKPAWALDLPIAAKAWTGKRYTK
jgi:DNA polymerase